MAMACGGGVSLSKNSVLMAPSGQRARKRCVRAPLEGQLSKGSALMEAVGEGPESGGEKRVAGQGWCV